jgi:predicted metal-dependent enzyme (double-stranded beta helix superfamily)
MAPELYSIRQFMSDAKSILDSGSDLPSIQGDLAQRLSKLSQRDDLLRYGAQLGPTDASNASYLLWREPPHFTLMTVKFDQYFASPVHDHGDHWIVACGYRGTDRWDIYQRTDGRTGPGHATLELADQIVLTPGDTAALRPPRSIHSHNNIANGDTLELIFSAVRPIPAAERMIYDIPEGTCRPSHYEISQQLVGERYP